MKSSNRSKPSDSRTIAGKVLKWYGKWIKQLAVDKSTKWAMSSELLDILALSLPMTNNPVSTKHGKGYSIKKPKGKYINLVKKHHKRIAKNFERISRISPAMRGNNEIQGI